jgi:hypothetical protein
MLVNMTTYVYILKEAGKSVNVSGQIEEFILRFKGFGYSIPTID